MSNLKHEIGQEQLSVTQRTKIKRMPSRGHCERELVYQILDEGSVCRALEAFTEHIVPGRWAEVRQPTPQELIVTSVLKLPLSEASAKVRTGPPDDEEQDYSIPVWAGIIPLKLIATTPTADSRLPQEMTLPSYLHNYTRNRSR
jgi:hypothetical protein